MVVVLSMGIGLFAPPVGVGYYSACAIERVNLDKGILRPILAYMVALLLGAILVAAAPWLRSDFSDPLACRCRTISHRVHGLGLIRSFIVSAPPNCWARPSSSVPRSIAA